MYVQRSLYAHPTSLESQRAVAVYEQQVGAHDAFESHDLCHAVIDITPVFAGASRTLGATNESTTPDLLIPLIDLRLPLNMAVCQSMLQKLD